VTRLVVAAAILERDGRILITRRLKGTHLEGVWEFPGGKCEPGETLEACLGRELFEELGITAVIGRELLTTSHAYDDRVVELHFLTCTSDDEPKPLLNQEMRWAARNELAGLEFPPADAELIQWLSDTSGGTSAANGSATTVAS
jgi:mutator protein MutT